MRAAAVLAGAALLAGCGGGGGGSHAPAASTATTRGAPTDAQIRAALGLPARVPLRATGRAPAEQVQVVRSWLDDLRRGEVAAAAALFAIPSRFQNLREIARIRTPSEAVAITASLPCGARMTKAGGAAGFVVYEARLTDRPGGGCGAGVGGVVRGAVLVRGGHMVEWYRLPDVAPSPVQQPTGPTV